MDKALLNQHIADGNLHFITWTGDPADVKPIYDTVYEVVHQFDGTVAAIIPHIRPAQTFS